MNWKLLLLSLLSPINRKKFLTFLLKRLISDLKASFLIGFGIFIIFGFIIGIFLHFVYYPLDYVGQWIGETLLKLFNYPIDLPSGVGCLIMVIVGTLFGCLLRLKIDPIDRVVSKIPGVRRIWKKIKPLFDIDWWLLKIPGVNWIWKQIRNIQTGLEQLKNYKPVRIATFPGIKEIFLAKRIKWEKYREGGWKAEGFLPSANNPTSGRAFISVDIDTIDAKITNSIEEVLAYIVSCTISAPEPDWSLEEIDWKKDFGVDISQPQSTA